jgi:hypothetical protein
VVMKGTGQEQEQERTGMTGLKGEDMTGTRQGTGTGTRPHGQAGQEKKRQENRTVSSQTIILTQESRCQP